MRSLSDGRHPIAVRDLTAVELPSLASFRAELFGRCARQLWEDFVLVHTFAHPGRSSANARAKVDFRLGYTACHALLPPCWFRRGKKFFPFSQIIETGFAGQAHSTYLERFSEREIAHAPCAAFQPAERWRMRDLRLTRFSSTWRFPHGSSIREALVGQSEDAAGSL